MEAPAAIAKRIVAAGFHVAGLAIRPLGNPEHPMGETASWGFALRWTR